MAEENIINKENEEEKTKINIDEKPKKNKINWTGIMFNILAIICISMFAISISPKELQNDTFYTIKLGEEIYNNGIDNLTQDNYSWIDLPYTYPHWLYDLSMFLIYNSFGHLGIYISTMVLAAILGISIYLLSNKKSKNKVVSFLVTIGAMILVKPYIAARAQLVTFILFVWTIYFIEKLLETNKIRYLIPLFIIPLLIANIHSAVYLFYFVLFIPYIAADFIRATAELNVDLVFVQLVNIIKRAFTKNEEKKKLINQKILKVNEASKRRDEKRDKLRKNPYKIKIIAYKGMITLMIVIIPMFCIGLLNPVNYDSYTYLIKTFEGNTTDNINEHKPLVVADNVKYMIAIAIFLIILIFTDTKIKLADLFMAAGLIYLSIKSMRQISMLAIIGAPILATLISNFVNKYDKQTFEKIEKFLAGFFGGTIMICCFIIISTNLIKENIHADYISKSEYPVEAVEWMKKNLDIENMKLYNEYNYGSYLLLNDIPVFIDSRCDLYTPEFNADPANGIEGKDIFSDALNIAAFAVDYESKFDYYGVTHVMLKESANLTDVLRKDSNYKLLYEKDNFLIFEKLDAVSNKAQ